MTLSQESLVARLENKALPLWPGAAREAANMIKGLCERVDQLDLEIRVCEKRMAAILKTVTR